MHIVIEIKKFVPMVSIERVLKLFNNFMQMKAQNHSEQIVIDEDLFVYIVEKYDGFSLMMNFTQNIDDRIKYLKDHGEDGDNRGLMLASNQLTLQQVVHKSLKINDLYQSTLQLMSEQIISKIKQEVNLCVLDPNENVPLKPNENSVLTLNSIVIPTVENSMFDIDQTSQKLNPNGASTYDGVHTKSNQKVDVMVYPIDILQYIS